MSRRPYISALRTGLLVIGFVVAATPACAIRELTPREEFAAQVARGELDAGRDRFRKEITRLRQELDRAPGPEGIEGLGRRANLVNDLALTIQSWADGEATALYRKTAPSPEPALGILRDELLPAAVDVARRRAAYAAEADRLEATLDPAAKASAGWALDAARLPEEARARLPLSLARLAKVGGSRAEVQRVFAAFGGRVGTLGSASAYFDAPEDFSRSLVLTPSMEPPPVTARSAPASAPVDEAAIRALLARFYRALVKHDARGVDATLASASSQRTHIKRRMRGRGIVGVGEIGRLTVEPRPDGSVSVTAEDVPITVRQGGQDVTRTGTQSFVVVREAGDWKILEVGR